MPSRFAQTSAQSLAEILRPRLGRGHDWRSRVAGLLALVLVVTLSGQVRHERPATAAPTQPGSACPPIRPDEAAARVTARICKGRVEVGNLASATRSVWANPNGSMSIEVSALPKRARQTDG